MGSHGDRRHALKGREELRRHGKVLCWVLRGTRCGFYLRWEPLGSRLLGSLISGSSLPGCPISLGGPLAPDSHGEAAQPLDNCEVFWSCSSDQEHHTQGPSAHSCPQLPPGLQGWVFCRCQHCSLWHSWVSCWVPLPSLQSATVTTRRRSRSRSLIHTMGLEPHGAETRTGQGLVVTLDF